MRDHGLGLDEQQRETLDARKRLHEGLNKFINDRGGWLTSIPGAPIMRFEAPPESSLPDELRRLGYDHLPAAARPGSTRMAVRR